MTRILSLIFLAIYPIAPSFFKILGFDSGVILSIVYSILYAIVKLAEGRLRVNKKVVLLLLICFAFVAIPLIAHGEYTRLVRCFVERVFVILLLIDFFDKDGNEDKAIKILIYVALVFSIIGIIESLTGTSIFASLDNSNGSDIGPELQYRGSIVRSETVFGHSITYGIYLSFLALLSSFKLNFSKERVYKIAYIFIIINLVLTISRAPIIVFFIVQLLLLMFWGRKMVVNAILKSFAIGVCVIAVASFIPGLSNIIQTSLLVVAAVFSDNAFSRVSTIGIGNPFEYRIELLKTIPQYIQGHYLVGRGAAFSLVFSMFGHQYYSVDNAYLAWTIHDGIIGTIGYILPTVITFVLGVITYRKNNDDKLSICIALCAVAYLLNLFSVAQMGEYRIGLILFALAISHYRKLSKE